MGKGGKGGKKKSRGKKLRDTTKALNYKEDNQAYACVVKLLGDSRVQLRYYHEKRIHNSIGIIRGKMKRRVWISVGDLVLVGLRDFQDGKVDIIDKYSQNHMYQLVKEKEIPMKLITGKTSLQSDETKKNKKNKKETDPIDSDDDDFILFGYDNEFDDKKTPVSNNTKSTQKTEKEEINLDEI